MQTSEEALIAKANELYGACKIVGTSGKQFIAFAKKAGIPEFIAKAVLADNGGSEKRKTFRTEVEAAAIDFLLANPSASEKECGENFDSTVAKYYGSTKAEKAQNTMRHRDAYLSNYYAFAKAVLQAKAKADESAAPVPARRASK